MAKELDREEIFISSMLIQIKIKSQGENRQLGSYLALEIVLDILIRDPFGKQFLQTPHSHPLGPLHFH